MLGILTIADDGSISKKFKSSLYLEQVQNDGAADMVQISEDVFAFLNSRRASPKRTGKATHLILETYQIKNGIISPQSLDFFKMSGTFDTPNIIHASGDIYLITDASGWLYTIEIISDLDSDGDGERDAYDIDDDNDGVLDGSDNCPLTGPAEQTDTDFDGIGDLCDLVPNQPWGAVAYWKFDELST